MRLIYLAFPVFYWIFLVLGYVFESNCSNLQKSARAIPTGRRPWHVRPVLQKMTHPLVLLWSWSSRLEEIRSRIQTLVNCTSRGRFTRGLPASYVLPTFMYPIESVSHSSYKTSNFLYTSLASICDLAFSCITMQNISLSVASTNMFYTNMITTLFTLGYCFKYCLVLLLRKLYRRIKMHC